MFELQRYVGGRILGVDRAALPALASQAAVAAGEVPVGHLLTRAAAFEGSPAGPGYRLVGGTAVVSIAGLITNDALLLYLLGGTHPDAVARGVRAASADAETSSIVLLVDSPGGTVDLVPEAAAAIREARVRKPVTTIVRSQMHSAAYWLGAQASAIVATPSAGLGGLGVFVVHHDYSTLNARIGVTPTYISSSPEKVEGNPDEPLAEAARIHLQRRVDETFAQFVRDVSLGRRSSETAIRRDYGVGRSYGAVEAQRRGLADRVGTLEELLDPALRSRMSSGTVALTTDQEHVLIAAVLEAGA